MAAATNTDLDMLAAAWTRLGAMFNVAPAPDPVDLERLLLDTARAVPASSRLFSLAATWLASYGHYIDDARLARLIRDGLEDVHRPSLGLLLESARPSGEGGGTVRFAGAVAMCRAAVDSTEAGPLFDVDRCSPAHAALARQGASALSRNWGRWAEEIEFKFDALRPEHWVIASNPEIAARRTGRADGRR